MARRHRGYYSIAAIKGINKLIEKAILEADVKAIKVVSLGLSNQGEQCNRNGEIYVEKHPKLNVKVVDGSSLAIAVVRNNIPKGTSHVVMKNGQQIPTMSPRVSRCVPQRVAGPSSQRKKIVLEVDLNSPPPGHFHFDEVGPSSDVPVVPEMRGVSQRPLPPPVTIDVDSIDDDDDVILSSPRAFVEAKTNSRRYRRRNNVVDVELVESANRDAPNIRNKRRRIPANQPIINCESYGIFEASDFAGDVHGRNMSAQTRVFVAPSPPPPPPPPPPPLEPAFSCPVCMGPLVEEITTKCGHIFCKACIKKAIGVQGKCPTCRRKVTMKDTIRIYLPKTS